MKKTTILILTISAITSHPKLLGELQCSPGCLQCENSHCLGCYQRHPTSNFQCSESLSPESDHCDIYNQENTGCTWCKEGYAAEMDISGKCQEVNIDRCRVAAISRGISFCLICRGGFPQNDLMSCGKFEEQIGPKENCEWGAVQSGNRYCMKCKSGFNAVKGVCVAEVIEGCLFSSQVGFCQICDAWNGYFSISGDGKCTRI